MSGLRRPENLISIKTETIVKTALIFLATYILVVVVMATAHQLRLVGLSLFLAVVLSPAVSWTARQLRTDNRVLSTGVAYIFVLGVLISVLSLIVPVIFSYVREFLFDAGNAIEALIDNDIISTNLAQQLNLVGFIDSLKGNLLSQPLNISPAFVMDTVNRASGLLISLITVLVLGFMMLVEGPHWVGRFVQLQAVEKRTKIKKVIDDMYGVVTGYANGQLLIASTGATFALLAMLLGNIIFGTQVNAVALAFIIFLFGMIPIIGISLGAIVVVILTSLSSLLFAGALIIYFFAYQQLENAIFEPLMQSRTSHLTPLLVLVSALLGLGMAGILGAFLAVPIAGCLRILLEYKLGDKVFPHTHHIKKPHKPTATSDK
jgi:predicted PurR-regulated permease PerM